MATIPLSLYLWRRIYEVGIESIMGLPGDFNLNWLDAIYDVPGLRWVGNANELNAAYAADGYARIKGLPGCLVTTHGVGELSAINGVAGAASENIPIIHIVGQTPRRAQESHALVHHNVGFEPDHQLFNKMSAPMRCAAAELWDAKSAPAEIDRAIRECFVKRLPVYIFFPVDMALEPVEESLLDRKIDLSWPVDQINEDTVADAIATALYHSRRPALFVDHLVHTFGFEQTVELADRLRLPTYVAHMSKGIIDEDKDYFIGVYNGSVTEPGTESIKDADVLLCLGWWPTDSNSSVFNRGLPADRRIDIMGDHVVVLGKRFDGVYMAPLLKRLTASIDLSALPPVTLNKVPRLCVPLDADDKSLKLTHKYIWPRFSDFVLPGDVIFGEIGTASYGVPDSTFKPNTTFISQSYYGSIGYVTPAALGSDLALAELHAHATTAAAPAQEAPRRRRTVCITGDGSLQLTMQEVGTMVARGLRVVLVIINNAGYTIERAIHGARQRYNDIVPYQHRHLLALFGAAEPDRQYRACHTRAEFDAAMADPAILAPTRVEVVELFMDRCDIPWRLAQVLCTRPGAHAYLAGEGFNGLEVPRGGVGGQEAGAAAQTNGEHGNQVNGAAAKLTNGSVS